MKTVRYMYLGPKHSDHHEMCMEINGVTEIGLGNTYHDALYDLYERIKVVEKNIIDTSKAFDAGNIRIIDHLSDEPIEDHAETLQKFKNLKDGSNPEKFIGLVIEDISTDAKNRLWGKVLHWNPTNTSFTIHVTDLNLCFNRYKDVEAERFKHIMINGYRQEVYATNIRVIPMEFL